MLSAGYLVIFDAPKPQPMPVASRVVEKATRGRHEERRTRTKTKSPSPTAPVLAPVAESIKTRVPVVSFSVPEDKVPRSETPSIPEPHTLRSPPPKGKQRHHLKDLCPHGESTSRPPRKISSMSFLRPKLMLRKSPSVPETLGMFPLSLPILTLTRFQLELHQLHPNVR